MSRRYKTRLQHFKILSNNIEYIIRLKGIFNIGQCITLRFVAIIVNHRIYVTSYAPRGNYLVIKTRKGFTFSFLDKKDYPCLSDHFLMWISKFLYLQLLKMKKILWWFRKPSNRSSKGKLLSNFSICLKCMTDLILCIITFVVSLLYYYSLFQYTHTKKIK